MDLEHKTFDLAELSLKGGANDPGEIEGYGAVFGNWDRQKDKILPGAFTNTIPALLKDGFMSWGHDLHSPPIASFSELHEDGKGLYFRAQFHSTPEAQAARRVAQERIERGKSMGCSITYGVKQKEYVREGRLLKELVVPEICLTPIPANQLANATGVKAVLSEATGYAPHADYTGTHSHSHPAMGSQGGDATHTHSHTHHGGSSHDHSHEMGGKASGIACPFCSGRDTTTSAACQCNVDCGTEGCPKGPNDAADDTGKSAGGLGNKAVWDSGYISDLPDSAFACVDDSGRHYPHHDKSGAVDDAHLKAALSRIGDSSNTQCGKAHLEAHAKAEGIGDRSGGKVANDDRTELKTFAEQSYTALAAAEDFLARAHSLAELRGKAGRTISMSNRARLSDLKDQLMACCDSIDEMMAMSGGGSDMAAPGKSSDDGSVDATAEYMDLQRILARGYGVPV